jgi:catechol-2,3-dioxygenase
MARLVGINHVALEVADAGQAFDWYGRFISFDSRGRVGSRAAFIDMGDQFLAHGRTHAAPRRGKARRAGGRR